MRWPEFIKPGDTIGLAAPAGPVEAEAVERAIKYLQSKGYRVAVDRKAIGQSEALSYLAADDWARAQGFNALIRDQEVKAIIMLRGGYGCQRILPLIDYRAISENPKFIAGYSDITALHTAIHNNCGLVTLHAPMAAVEFTRENIGQDDSERSFWAHITGCLRQDICCGQPVFAYNAGAVSAEVVGGNLTLICSSLATPFEIVTKNRILFIEDIDEAPYRIDRMLLQLRYAGKLADCAGFIIGGFTGCGEDASGKNEELDRIICEYILAEGKQVIHGFPCGHMSPNITLPLGARITIIAHEDGSGRIMLEDR